MVDALIQKGGGGMKPVLFEKTAIEFTTQGLGRLSDTAFILMWHLRQHRLW